MTSELSAGGIEQRIYCIRGQQVMLDRDLAHLYHVETRILNQTVRRNLRKFPGEDFVFSLSETEYKSLGTESQILENGRGKHQKYLPNVFTKIGIIMLSSILNNERALDFNLAVIRAFAGVQRMNPGLEVVKLVEHLDRLDERLSQIELKLSEGGLGSLQSQNLLSPKIPSHRVEIEKPNSDNVKAILLRRFKMESLSILD